MPAKKNRINRAYKNRTNTKVIKSTHHKKLKKEKNYFFMQDLLINQPSYPLETQEKQPQKKR